MTKEALKKLNSKQLEYCSTLSIIIDRDKILGAHDSFERDCGKLRGFLECLCQMGVITGGELRALYLFFFSSIRYTKEIEE